jgi:hypothetical protein
MAALWQQLGELVHNGPDELVRQPIHQPGVARAPVDAPDLIGEHGARHISAVRNPDFEGKSLDP